MQTKTRPIADRFWDKVDTSGACWLWTASRNTQGYGHFRLGQSIEAAHRVSWWLAYEDWPGTRTICHHCDNPPCVRPSHLFIGSQLDNMRDALAKGRLNPVPPVPFCGPGAANPSAKLTESAVGEIRYRHTQGARVVDLVSEFGVKKSQIYNILRRASWIDEGNNGS